MILARLFSDADITGVELEPKFLDIARLRATHYAFPRVTFLQSPRGDVLPERLGLFDAIIMPAVYEHLLPGERPKILRLLWSHLKPRGILFIDETPHRYFPIESHTSGLPFINYFPDTLALICARIFSRRNIRHDSWEALLRKGIRGGTPKEVLALIRRAGGKPELLKPNAPNIHNAIDLWSEGYALHAVGTSGLVKQKMRVLLRILRAFTGVELVPYLSLAIRKIA